jgi:hypothetical protein
VTFCHHTCYSSTGRASAGTGDDYENFPDADISELLDMLRRVPEFRAERGREYGLSFILAVCVVATLAGAKNSREITTVASGICQCQLMMMGARWDYFKNRYRPTGTTPPTTVRPHRRLREYPDSGKTRSRERSDGAYPIIRM